MVDAAVTARPARRQVDPRVALPLRAVAAVGAGVLLYASFPPHTTWWLAPPAFAVLAAVLRGRRLWAGAGYGYLFGLGFLLPLLSWTGSFVGWPWLFLPAFEALFIALTGAGLAAVSRLRPWLVPLTGAGVWVAGESIRSSVPFGGFPWGRVAFGQPDGWFLPLAAVGGSALLSFAVVLTGLGIAELVRTLVGRSWPVPGALATAAPLLLAVAAGPLVVDTAPQAGDLTAALVQGNVPRAGLDFNAQRRAVLDNHRDRTDQLAADVRAGRQPQPDLVLWPENAADIDPIRNADATAVVDAAADAVGAPILLGAILDPPPVDGRVVGPQNAVVRWEPGVGPTGQYVKRHIQPFGEYIPLRSVARRFSAEVDRVRRPLVPGDEVGVLDVAGTRVAIATCYEVAFDDIVGDAVRAGGTVLVVPTNNATFGYTDMTYQQLAMSRVRAVEHSRAVLVVATSGVSAVIGPDGQVRARTDLFTADALVAQVPLRTTATLASRLGAAAEWLLVAIGAAGLLLVALRHRRGPSGPRTRTGGSSDVEETN
jgi:apolipoprotein N-acyltransferase